MKKAVIIEVGVLRILVVLLQLVFLKIYTNNTSIYELGIYYFLYTVSYSLQAFLLVPLDYFQQSQIYTLKKEGASLKSFFSINKWLLQSSAILLLILLVLCYLVRPDYMSIISIIISMSLSAYFVSLLRGFINNLEKRRIAIYTLLIEGILKITFYWIYSKYFDSTAIIILIALLSSSIVTGLLLFYFVSAMDEYKHNNIKMFDSKDIIKFSYPISIGAVINWIQLQGYRMILVPLGLVEIVGIYGTVANVGTSGMSAFSTIYSQLFIPNLYKTNGAYLITYLKYALLSILAVLFGGYILRDFIITLLTKPEFIKYSSLIVYGIISEAGNFLIGAFTIYLTIQNLTKVSITASVAGLIAFTLSFLSLYLLNIINVYTIGLPIIITQLIITVYLAIIVYKSKKLSI